MRIFHAIEDDHEGILSALGPDYIVEIAVLLGRGDSDYTLMSSPASHLVEFGACEKFYRHAEFPAVFDHPLQADVVPLLRHADPLESASAGLERFADCVDPIDIVHEVSVYRKLRVQTVPACRIVFGKGVTGRARLQFLA